MYYRMYYVVMYPSSFCFYNAELAYLYYYSVLPGIAVLFGGTYRGRNFWYRPTGRGGLVVTRLPAAREDRGSRRAAGKSLCFHENHCDTQLWARAAH